MVYYKHKIIIIPNVVELREKKYKLYDKINIDNYKF